MRQDRRELLKASIAITVLSLSNGSAEAAWKKVGVISSINLKKIDPEMLCFSKGLELGGWTETAGAAKEAQIPDPNEAQGKYGGSYGSTQLENAISGHGSVHLIVAAGGVISRVAAAKKLRNIPYVYLSGMAPTPPSVAGKYCGVVLNIPARYANARNALVAARDVGDVWLVQNFNSGMTEGEKTAWRAGFRSDRDFRFFEPASAQAGPIDNNASAFAAQVAALKMKGSPKGVVVSPDAFFRMQQETFTSAITDSASGLNVPICFPFEDYPLRVTPADTWLRGGAKLSIGDMTYAMNTAYGQLGALAARMLDDPSQLVKSKNWVWSDAAGTGAWLDI